MEPYIPEEMRQVWLHRVKAHDERLAEEITEKWHRVEPNMRDWTERKAKEEMEKRGIFHRKALADISSIFSLKSMQSYRQELIGELGVSAAELDHFS